MEVHQAVGTCRFVRDRARIEVSFQGIHARERQMAFRATKGSFSTENGKRFGQVLGVGYQLHLLNERITSSPPHVPPSSQMPTDTVDSN